MLGNEETNQVNDNVELIRDLDSVCSEPTIPSLSTVGAGFGATCTPGEYLDSGIILLSGGETTSSDQLNEIFRLDLNKLQDWRWEVVGPLQQKRSCHQMIAFSSSQVTP